MNMTNQQTKRSAPPYVRWHVFEKYLVYLAGHGIPDILDPTVLSNVGEASRLPLLASMRYLGLATEDRKPTETLRKLVEREHGDRVDLYRQFLEQHYNFVLDKYPGLVGLNPTLLRQEFESLGIKGSTVDKGIDFFEELVKQAGLSMAEVATVRQPHVAVTPNGHKPTAGATTPHQNAVPVGGEIKTISLKNAGSLSLALNVSLLELRGKDREFVFSLIDQLQDYEEQNRQS